MTPADLADLLRSTATTVLDERGLDTSALPAVVTVERPRNPEHGDYATNVALQVAKRWASRRVTWPAGSSRPSCPTRRSPVPRSPGPGS